ncbi:MAG: hypothetical protein WCC76_19315, partial [Candidatus Acidiferrales bacterium]
GQLCQLWGRPAEHQQTPQAPGTILSSGSDALVECGNGTFLQIEAVQLEGRKRIPVRDFVNGARLKPGEKFGD